MNGVEVRGLTVAYGEVLALDDVSFAVGPGLTVLLGVNGSGKSSLLAAIAGSLVPTRGTVHIDGGDAAVARRAGRLAYVPQADAVDRDFPVSVSEVVAMGTYARHVSHAHLRVAVRDALARVGLDGLERRQIGELSGGQRRRVLLARALVQDAPTIVLDEPLGGVDAGVQATFYALLRELVGEGRTILMSTHDLASVPDLADRAILLHQRVIADGPPREALTDDLLARAFGVRR
ncbi:metal ABC transporter ATP-binding protein [Demequina pelophila]|uniref:metal ABC transporter ATP-binding protein n=1 Tax=Demequina pelophila TaxID=1638984 RepID=UPI00078430FC|nr:metal ABC transporter ATP-binding protein [Demequina pelophila]